MITERATTIESLPVRAGVIGVGAMGENHARVYSELPNTNLVGVFDLDDDQATRVADVYGSDTLSIDTLLEQCEIVTVAVPTSAHVDIVSTCLDAGVHVLVEKPIAETVERGRELQKRAAESGLVLQVGHIERFNPAVETVAEIIDDLDVIAIEAERLGPPIDRTDPDDVILDLMIHDVDVVDSLIDGHPEPVSASGTADGQYATATIRYDDVIASLTASRVTQKKVRRLTITARECLVEVDYLQQTVLLHRDSYPEYVTDDGWRRYRHESVVERPRIENGEPLRSELESFVEAARNGKEPVVSAADGLRALETVGEIERMATASSTRGR